MRLFVLVVLFGIVITGWCGAFDNILLFNGEEYEGIIIHEDNTSVVIRVGDTLYEFQKRRIARIMYRSGEVKLFEDTRTSSEIIADTSLAKSALIVVILLVLLVLINGD